MIDYQFMQSGATPLHMACQEGHIEVAQLLLHSGAQPNIPNKVSTTIILSPLLIRFIVVH